MSGPFRVEVRVRGCLGGDLLGLVGDLTPRGAPRHTVLTVLDSGADAEAGAADARVGGLTRLLDDLQRAGVELDRVLPCRSGSGAVRRAAG